MDGYDVALAVAGAATLGAAALPIFLSGKRLSYPIVYVAAGMALSALPFDVPRADPVAHGVVVERLSELAVIVALTGAGLKLDRPLGWRAWGPTWRLLAVAMPLTIVATGLLGWWVAGLAPAAAMLLGAAVAPTDPVLASDVQVGPPGQDDEEDDVRFTLTSEAGLNDGLAFPFTNAAIAAATATAASEWVGRWLLVDVVAKLAVAFVVGVLAGRAVAWVVFHLPSERRLAESTEGFVALAATLLTYGVTELCRGYGFLAVFVAAVVLRKQERDHRYHEVLHDSAESTERLLSALLLVLVGAAVVDGALSPLGWRGALVGVTVLLVLRPLAGLASLVRSTTALEERGAISFFGIRGIGSIYYLAHALNTARFPEADRLWAIVIFVVVASVVVHGVAATPVMRRLDERRAAPADAPA